MEKFYKLDGVFISDYQKDLFDKMDSYNIATPKVKKRLRQLYEEITSEAVFSHKCTTSSAGFPGTFYYYETRERWLEMKKKESRWWSDVLSATDGND